MQATQNIQWQIKAPDDVSTIKNIVWLTCITLEKIIFSYNLINTNWSSEKYISIANTKLYNSCDTPFLQKVLEI